MIVIQINQLCQIGGTSGEEDGTKVAYKIVDYVFDPVVLINYTWTGISRKENKRTQVAFCDREKNFATNWLHDGRSN